MCLALFCSEVAGASTVCGRLATPGGQGGGLIEWLCQGPDSSDLSVCCLCLQMVKCSHFCTVQL